MRRENFSKVAMFSNEVGAQLAVATLSAANIYSYIDADDAGGMIPAMETLKGVGVYVPDVSLEEARTVLGSIAEPSPETGPEGVNLGTSEV